MVILVKRSRPARMPADSAPTKFLTGSLLGPVMIRPRESVFTGPRNSLSSSGDSGPTAARMFCVNALESWRRRGLAEYNEMPPKTPPIRIVRIANLPRVWDGTAQFRHVFRACFRANLLTLPAVADSPDWAFAKAAMTISVWGGKVSFATEM